jgi:hypothetical protein
MGHNDAWLHNFLDALHIHWVLVLMAPKVENISKSKVVTHSIFG